MDTESVRAKVLALGSFLKKIREKKLRKIVTFQAFERTRLQRTDSNDSLAKIWSWWKPSRFENLIKEGELIPRWYGYAYRDFDLDAKHFYPIPLNYIVAIYRFLRQIFKYELIRVITRKDDLVGYWYRKGYQCGVEEGYKFGSTMREQRQLVNFLADRDMNPDEFIKKMQ